MLNRWRVEDDDSEGAGGSMLVPVASPLPHSYWVTGVASLAPDCHPLFPEGLTICGARDNLIRLYDMHGNLVKCLSGHDKPPGISACMYIDHAAFTTQIGSRINGVVFLFSFNFTRPLTAHFFRIFSHGSESTGHSRSNNEKLFDKHCIDCLIDGLN